MTFLEILVPKSICVCPLKWLNKKNTRTWLSSLASWWPSSSSWRSVCFSSSRGIVSESASPPLLPLKLPWEQQVLTFLVKRALMKFWCHCVAEISPISWFVWSVIKASFLVGGLSSGSSCGTAEKAYSSKGTLPIAGQVGADTALLMDTKGDEYQEPYQALKYAPYYSYSTVVMEMKDALNKPVHPHSGDCY